MSEICDALLLPEFPNKCRFGRFWRPINLSRQSRDLTRTAKREGDTIGIASMRV